MLQCFLWGCLNVSQFLKRLFQEHHIQVLPHLVVLPVQEEVKGDEIVVMCWWFHVEDKAMDAVLDEGPQEPAQHKKRQENVLMDRNGEVWEHTDNGTYLYT